MKTFFFTLFLLIGSTVLANPVDVTTAKLVATNYFKITTKAKVQELALADQTYASGSDTALYYVFNVGNNNGWIIISASDASIPVLAYNTSGKYSINDQPPAFAYWMEGCEEQLRQIVRLKLKSTSEIELQWNEIKNNQPSKAAKSTTTVGPLLSTSWNQNGYYNDWCPGNCPTGCVATAMAQILKYWNSPTSGTSDHCYNHPTYGQLCANFGTTTYDWGAMPNTVSSLNTPVATLMYHAGVSVEMDYCQNGTNASGAWVLTNDPNGYHPYSAQHAYPTYFGYNPNTIQGKLRSNYIDSYWINSVLKPELDASTPRPIQYVGWDVNGAGGHTWVCDGYNSNSYFHMNWGWGGTNDGWFSINNLNPGSYHFDNGQQALIGIQPMAGSVTICGNDNCNNAVTLVSNTTCQNTLCSVDNATPDGFIVPSCDNYTPQSGILGAGVFFKFIAVSATEIIKVTPTGTLDAVIVLYSGGCYNLIEVPGGCMDTPGGNGVVTILTVNNLVAGTEYTIRVYDYGSANATSGGFNICVTHNSGYTISTQSLPANGGTTTGGGTFPSGTYITLSASQNNGYTFSNWTENGNVVSTNSNYSFTVTSNRNLVANFTQTQVNYTISTQSLPANGGTTSGGGTFPSGTNITVYANQNNGYTFSNWTENSNVVSMTSNYSFTVTANRNLVANFTQTQVNYTISTQSLPANGGTTSGGGTFPSGTNITLTANQNNGYTFSNWTENGNVVSTNSNYSFTVTSNRNLVANFTQTQLNYSISTLSLPANGGTTTGGGTFPSGTNITVYANQNYVYTFSNWTENGNVVSTDSNYSFTVSSNLNLVANFTQTQVNYTISIQASPSNGGTTTGGGTFPSGTNITVFANQNNGYSFSNWTENGNVISNNALFSFTVNSNRNLIANFVQTGNNVPTKPMFTKLFDDIGDVNTYNSIIDFTQTQIDSSYLAIGESDINDTESSSYLISIDKNGGKRWVKYFYGLQIRFFQVLKSVHGFTLSFNLNDSFGLMEIDTDGNLVWMKTYNKFMSGLTTLDDGFLCTYNSATKLNIYKLDSYGNFLWGNSIEYSLSINEFAGINKIATDGMGGIYLAGETLFQDDLGSRDIFIQKIDANGNPIWNRRLFTSTGSNDFFEEISIINYSDIFIQTYENDANGNMSNGLIVKIDGNGNVLQTKTLPLNYAHKLVPSFGGDPRIRIASENLSDFNTTVVEYSSYFAELQRKTFQGLDYYTAKTTFDDKIVCGGQFSSYIGNGTFDNQFRFFKVSLEGDNCLSIPTQNYSLGTGSINAIPVPITALSSAYLNVTSTSISFTSVSLQESTYCDDEIYTDIKDTTNLIKQQHVFSVYPNPTTDHAAIGSEKAIVGKYLVELFNIDGRIVLSREFYLGDPNKTANIDLTGLANGIYVLKVSGSKYMQSIRIVKQ